MGLVLKEEVDTEFALQRYLQGFFFIGSILTNKAFNVWSLKHDLWYAIWTHSSKELL